MKKSKDAENEMSYSNEFLRDFRPIFFAILQEKRLSPARVELEVIDEEDGYYSIFEPADVRDVLEQLSEDLNYLTIYTERPAYFEEFAETMYEENGLIVTFFPKKQLKASRHGKGEKLVLDFEWEGRCYEGQICSDRYYVPIHKKPWERAENLDIMIPIGYNTVIVKSVQYREKQPERDRYEAAFYD